MTSPTPYITIVLPCRNEVRFIDSCLESIFHFEPVPGGFEVLVVDGSSNDGTQQKLVEWQQRRPELRVLQNPRGVVPTAMNIGIQAARGELILRLDAHSTYPPEYMRLCAETHARTKADNVGGVVITLPRGDTPAARIVQALTTHHFGVGNAGFRVGATEGPADTVPFGCFRSTLFKRTGLLDERLVRNQDYELNCRIRKTGGVIWLNPEIQIQYYNQGTVLGLLRQAFATSRWNVWMWHVAPYSFALRHCVPGIFLVALLIGIALVPFTWLGPLLLAGAGISYGALALLSSAQQALRYGWWLAVVLPVMFLAYHLAYGAGIVWGALLLAFRASPVQRSPEPWAGAGRYRALPFGGA
jgi:succinoglycan biosynthesis protein ExoA